MAENKDPFAEFGGKSISKETDPFAEFGGKSLKKKDQPISTGSGPGLDSFQKYKPGYGGIMSAPPKDVSVNPEKQKLYKSKEKKMTLAEAQQESPVYLSKEYFQKKGPGLVSENIVENIAPAMATLNNLTGSIYKIPRLIYNSFAAPQNMAADLLNMPELKADYDSVSKGTYNPLSVIDIVGDYSIETGKKWEEKQRKYDQGIFESIKSGNLNQAGLQIADNITGSIPGLVSMYMTGGLATAANAGNTARMFSMAAPFASSKSVEIQDNPDVPEYIKPVVSWLNGLAEVVYEEGFGTKAIIDNAIGIAGKQGRGAAVDFLKSVLSPATMKVVSKVQPITNVLSNSTEEAITTLTQNIIDKYSGVNPDLDIMSGVVDAAIVGGAQGAGATIAGKGIDYVVNPQRRAKVDSLVKSRENIVNDIDNSSVGESQKVELTNRLSDINEEISKELESNREELKLAPSELVDEANDIQTRIDDKIESVSSPDISEDTRIILQSDIDELSKELKAKNKQIEDAVQIAKTSKVPVQPETAISEEVVEGKPQAEPEVITEVGQEEVIAPVVQEVKPTKVKYSPEEQVRVHQETGGSTFRVTGENLVGKPAASVSIFPERSKIVTKPVTKAMLKKFAKDNADLLDGNEDVLAVGTWFNSETGETYLDVVAALPKNEAAKLGSDYNQIAVFDLETMEEIPTGGTGEMVEGLKPEVERVDDIRRILGETETGLVKRPAGQLAEIEQPSDTISEEGAPEQKKLGASRIVGEAEAPVEFAEFEEVEPDLDKAKADLANSIETPFRNKEKLKKTSKSWVARFIKALADNQYNVVRKLIKEGGDVGRIAAAALENRKGYSGPASIFVRDVNNEIFDNLSITPNVDIVGRKTSESELFDVFLNLNRIINIDNRIAEKFSQLLSVDRKLNDLINSKSKDSAQIEKLQNEKDLLLDYLESRKAIAVQNGEYVPVQYVHSGNRTAKTARAELEVIKREQPELYKKFEDYAFKYNNFYRDLLELQYKNNLISKEVFDELFSYNYIPTKYIQHFIETELAQDNPVLAAKLSSSIKNLTGGSDSDVITNFQAIIELYTNSVYRKIYDNRASNALARNIFATSNNNTDIMKINQLVKDTDAGLNPKGIYSMNLNMFIQEPTGADKFGNPTYGGVPTGYDVIYFYRDNGKRERIVAPVDFVDEWYERGGNLTPQGEKNLSRASKWTLVNLFKALITKYNPTFGIFQITMDAPQALIASEAYPDLLIGSAQLAVDYAKVSGDIKKFITNGELGPLFKEALDAGIFSDFLSTENDIIRSQTLVSKDGSLDYASAAKILLKRVSSKVEGALQSVAQFNEAIEYMTRLAVYRRMKEKLTAQYIKDSGGAELTDEQKSDIRTLAAQQARNIVNFSRAGSIGKHANKLFAYLNAGIQGFYSVAKSLKNNPTKAAVMISEIGLAGVGLLASSIGDFGDDEREKKKRLQEYLMLSDYQRANYFNIYNPFSDDPEKRWIKIYKPQPFRGWINFCEQGYLSAVHGIDIDQKEMVKTFMDDLPVDPSTVDLLTRNPMVNAAVKYRLNKDAFRSEDVVRNEEKIEDWAEGADDKNVSKIYKNLGKATAGLFGAEGISPKRAQAAVQSLVGDPSRNATTAFIDKGGKALFYLATGDKEGLEQEFPDEPLVPFIARTVGVNARLFNKTPKLDNEFMETLEKDRRAEFTKRMIIRSEIEEIFDKNESPKEATKIAVDRLKELINNKDITVKYAGDLMKAQSKRESVEGKPSWYKSLLYAQNNEEKAEILSHYTKDYSQAEYVDAAKYLLAKGIIKPEVIYEVAKLKQNAKQKK